MTTRTIYIVPATRQSASFPVRSGTSTRQLTIGRHVPVSVRQSPLSVPTSSVSLRPAVVKNATILQPVTRSSTVTLAQKRPASVLDDSVTDPSAIDDLLGLSNGEGHPVRKRERLTHLTSDEKQRRRKLKNRVAAQTARDRKKVRTGKLEEVVYKLVNENKALREENKKVNNTCEQLKWRNAELERCLKADKSDASHTAKSSLGSAEGTGDCSAVNVDAPTNIPSDLDLEEILDDLLQDDPELERFCSKMLDGEEEFAAVDAAETPSTAQVSSSSRVDSPSSHIYLAPEYLQSSPRYNDSPSPSVSKNSSPSPSLSPSQRVPSPGANTVYESSICSPVSSDQLYFDDIKLDFDQSPFIGNDDPLLGAPLPWDDFTIVDDTFALSADL